MKTFATQSLLAAALSVMTLAHPGVVAAQTGGPQLTFGANACVTTNYPEVVCTVGVLDGNGVPLKGVAANQFDVTTDNNQAVTELRVSERVNATQTANVVLVLDFGATAPGIDVEGLKTAAKAVIGSLGENDQIALIGITGQIDLGDTVNPPINSKSEIGFVQAGPRKNEVINLITTLQPQGNTPIYDAVCKALILAGKQKVGTRAVIVISDGLDRKSRTCVTDASQINRAKSDKTPVFAIGVGQNVTEDYLRSVTFQTGGKYFGKAANVAAIDTGFKEMLGILKTQYEVRFKSPVAADNQDHTVKVGINLPNGREDATARYKAVPSAVPELRKLVLLVNDRDVQPRELPDTGRLVVAPELVARQVARVEYDLAGDKVIADKQPFSAEFDLAKLPKNADQKLVVRVIGDEKDPRTIVTREETLFVKAAIAPTAAPRPTATPAPAPTILQRLTTPPLLYLLIAGAVLTLALLGLLLMLLLRRRKSAKVDDYYQPPTGVFTPGAGPSTGSMPALDPFAGGQTAAQSIAPPEPTSVMQPPSQPTMVMGGESNKTQVLTDAGKTMIFRPGKAVLEFTGGEMTGQRFQLGGTTSEHVNIGREVNGIGDIKIKSSFVSRKHAEIKLQDDKLFLTDLGSASGTKLNGDKVEARTPVEVKVGDKIEFADAKSELKAP